MPKRKSEQNNLFDISELLSTAACVPAIRAAVKEWREKDYPGTTETTRELLDFWFNQDHIMQNGTPFHYHNAQREAIETLIYIFEVAKIRSRKELLTTYAFSQKDLRLPPYDDFARYCIKMATGSGKTKVMTLAIVWQYANAIKENAADYAKTFLIIAPNVIVFERLKTDFEGGRIFRTDPLTPKHYKVWWDMEYYMRGDTEKAYSSGALYLTNIQQFYERADSASSQEPDIMTQILGPAPATKKVEMTDFDTRIAKREGQVLVINDEAHHTHDEENEWNKFIRNLHTLKPLSMQLDFSATPRYSKGSLFAWTIFDYPLKQAILDGIVKRPMKGISNIEEAKSDIASVKYQGFMVAAVERWKEYRQQLSDLNKKPILFIMLNTTDEAEDIGDWLRTKYPEDFAGEKTLIIHTDKSGDVSKKDLDKARIVAREVDEETSPVNAIVSVLMLREGWDVQNVTVVVGLRPYTAKANILPEQTIGRGLRLMFRNMVGSFTERVDIIGNKAFLNFVDELEKIEGIQFDTFQVGKDKLTIITIQPVEEKKNADIGIPQLNELIGRKSSLASEIEKINVMEFNINPLPLKSKGKEVTKTFVYEGIDILTNEKLLERQYQIPPAQTPEEVIGYYARRIANDIKLPSQFASLAPKIKEFFKFKAFGQAVNLYDRDVIQSMSSNVAAFVVIDQFEKILKKLVVEEHVPELMASERMLSETPPFPFSRPVYESDKTVFNFVACDNQFEREFARFLDNSEDVKAFAKLPEQFGFSIQYTDTRANIRNYFPDFIVKLITGENWLIETKGMEDVNVKMKDIAAQNWCEKATELTGTSWSYLKVLQKDYEALHPDSFSELLSVLKPPTLFD